MTALACTTRTWLSRLALIGAVLGGIAAVAAWLQGQESRGEGPRPVAWGEAVCAHCRMLVSDPRYAAQIVTADGEVLNFDDPGCLLRHLDDTRPHDASVYFHHSREDRWLKAPAVAFARGDDTPMGFGLRAVDPGSAGAIDYAAAARAVRTSPEKGTH
jgi:hypothetical protein